MRQAETKAEPKTESFDESEKVSGSTQQQQQSNQLQSTVATTQATNASFVETNGNSEGNEILVLVPALNANANGLTTANITTTEYRENGQRNLERKSTNDLQNYTRDNTNNTRNSIVTEQIVWIPKIDVQQSEHNQHQSTSSVGSVSMSAVPPLYSRIKQLNYSQVENKCFL